jgi:hypothetical protein
MQKFKTLWITPRLKKQILSVKFYHDIKALSIVVQASFQVALNHPKEFKKHLEELQNMSFDERDQHIDRYVKWHQKAIKNE